jgi:putative DNA primase/helicase
VKRLAPPADTLAIALSLAKHAEWPIFPVHLNVVTKDDGTTKVEKKPAIKGWTDGAASTDAETILTWFTIDFPEAWIGVYAEGAGIVVPDLDPDKGQGAGRDNLKAAGHKLPRTFHYPSRSPGGEHYVYRAPAGRTLTIGQGHPVPGVDIRAGHGLMVYYGPKLDAPPVLAPAPDWSLLDRGTSHALTDTDAAAWFAAQIPGKAPKKLRRLADTITERGCDRTIAMPVVAELVKAGSNVTPGVAPLLAEARERYTKHYPEKAGDWDALVAGSIRKFGMPPVTLPIPKAERKAIAQRNTPAAVEERKTERKVEWMTMRRQGNGPRLLEDGPLAVELAEALSQRWAWSSATGLLRYDGKVWRPAEHQSLIEAVRQGLEVIEVEEHAALVRLGASKGEIAKALSLLNRTRMRNVADLVLGIYMEHDLEVDQHPDLLNTPTGIVDLTTGELRPHDPALMFTKITEAEYDPTASSQDWRTALKALPKDVRRWMQVRFGQGITGHMTSDDKVPFLSGGGKNGKSAVLGAINKAAGSYSVIVPDRLLLANAGDHPTELTTLMGARLAFAEELPEGRHLNTKRLKDIAGTPEITARRMRQDFVTWHATHSLFVSTNHKPLIAETDGGTWRRTVLVRFPWRYRSASDPIETAYDKPADENLRERLKNRADPAVLAWLVEGAVAWYAAGKVIPPVPETVTRDTQMWREDSDLVLGYVGEKLVKDDNYAIACSDLTRDFNDWLLARGNNEWSASLVNSRFEGHESMVGVDRKRVKFGKVMPSRPSSFMSKPIPANTNAWRGVRFADDPLPTAKSPELAEFERRMAND